MTAEVESAETHWLTSDDLARLLQVKPGTIANWRTSHKGPPFVRIGGFVRYRSDAVRSWIETQPTT
ncbi:helix-turn-helix domain-containing protein [Pseudarthrobacter sp. PS3-L1]|uniref:helix-turn-helix domain-containing protein n=1 Tax=Pseudarthrobacter sp. PS3-L1 TaxID=3046207 RepID=UPI0024BAB129|nr:helix-turn-helix domain-containing protein [Pseudarthrobacter sp. PS3-L1]MDJ0321689.1 helix-turn-helix domain-containing protein [Pseudarthrobacter sp. PS3-L1]